MSEKYRTAESLTSPDALVDSISTLRTNINEARRNDLNEELMLAAQQLKRVVVEQFGSARCLLGSASWQALVGGTVEDDVIPDAPVLRYVDTEIAQLVSAFTQRLESDR